MSISNGKVAVTKGKVPTRLLRDFTAVLDQTKQAKIIAHRHSDGLKLSYRGDINESLRQRLRNIVGIHF